MMVHVRNKCQTDLFVRWNGEPSVLIPTGQTLDADLPSENVVLQISHSYDSYVLDHSGRKQFIIVLDSEIRLSGLMPFDVLDLFREHSELPDGEPCTAVYDRIALFCRPDLHPISSYFPRGADALIPIYQKNAGKDSQTLFGKRFSTMFSM